MNSAHHPGLQFQVGDIVVPVKRYHPIMLRSDPHTSNPDWNSCPVWYINTPGIIVAMNVDLNSVGEVVFKLVTPDGVGWVDWWNINRSSG